MPRLQCNNLQAAHIGDPTAIVNALGIDLCKREGPMLKPHGKTARNKYQRRGTALGRPVAAFLVLLLTGSLAFAGSSKVSQDLSKLSPSSNVNVIVQYYNAAGTADTNAATAVGATDEQSVGQSKLNRYTMTPAAAAKLAANSNVKYISPDRPLKGASFDTNIMAVNADLATNLGYDGTGISIAVIDSGVNSINDLKSRVVYFENLDPSSRPSFRPVRARYSRGRRHPRGVEPARAACTAMSPCGCGFQRKHHQPARARCQWPGD